MTKTFSSTLSATILTLAAILGDGPLAEVTAGLRLAADHAERAIADAWPLVEGLAAELADAEHLFVVGGGLAYPAALEAALKLKEMALVHAEASETWEMASGPATMVGPSTVVVSLAPDGPARAATDDVVRHCRQWGARVIEVAPSRAVEDSRLLAVPAAVDDASPAHHGPTGRAAGLRCGLRGATPTGRLDRALSQPGPQASWASDRRGRDGRIRRMSAVRVPLISADHPGHREQEGTASMGTAELSRPLERCGALATVCDVPASGGAGDGEVPRAGRRSHRLAADTDDRMRLETAASRAARRSNLALAGRFARFDGSTSTGGSRSCRGWGTAASSFGEAGFRHSSGSSTWPTTAGRRQRFSPGTARGGLSGSAATAGSTA